MQPKAKDPTTDLKKRQLVLLVDDDVDWRESLMSALGSKNIDVVAFETGEEASHYIETHPQPDLAIFDFQLKPGGYTGANLALQFRQNCSSEKPILFLSSDPQIGFWARQINRATALAKRTSLSRVLAFIESLLNCPALTTNVGQLSTAKMI